MVKLAARSLTSSNSIRFIKSIFCDNYKVKLVNFNDLTLFLLWICSKVSHADLDAQATA